MGMFAFEGPPDSTRLPSVGMGTKNLALIQKEVEKGLPNETSRITQAQKNQDFYDGDMERWLDWHEAESAYDHAGRPKRLYPLTTRVVDVLCEHLYGCPPRRRIAQASADRWLQGAYAENHVDALLHEADRLATLNDVAMLQVSARGGPAAILDGDGNDTGEFTPDAGINIHVHGSEEFAVYADPADPRKPWCVVTITRFDERTRYQVWTAEEVATYYTRQAVASGGRVAEYDPAQSGRNPYGILPFVFFHYRVPTRDFWTAGPGSGIQQSNAAINSALSELALTILTEGRTILVGVNMQAGERLVLRPGGITMLPASPAALANGLEPRLDQITPIVDIAGQWLDAQNTLYTTLELHGIPRSAIRLEQQSAASGVAIIAEQWPLITRAKKRRMLAACVEAELARVCLQVAGNYYGRGDLRAAALDPKLTLGWPEVQISMPGPDKDTADDWELSHGIKSKIQVLMDRRGLTREEAIAELAQIQEDNEALQAMGIDPAPPKPATPGDGTGPEDESGGEADDGDTETDEASDKEGDA
jgi:hypothetical protein